MVRTTGVLYMGFIGHQGVSYVYVYDTEFPNLGNTASYVITVNHGRYCQLCNEGTTPLVLQFILVILIQFIATNQKLVSYQFSKIKYMYAKYSFRNCLIDHTLGFT